MRTAPAGSGANAPAAMLVMAAMLCAASVIDARAADCLPGEGEVRTVMRVIDGETLLLDGGSELRLAGALAPRAYDGAAPSAVWPAAERSRLALEALVGSRAVTIASVGRRTDRHGRLLAQAFVGPTAGEGDAVWLQGEMLRQGWARAAASEGVQACLAALVASEAAAREKVMGLWAEPAYAVRQAEDVGALLRMVGTFQVVEGRALRIAEVRGALYINFGEDQRQDFTIVMRDRAVKAAAVAGLSPQSIEGRLVRVRGWIERRGGPLIEAADPALIEVLGEPATAAEAPQRRRRRTSARP